MAMRRPAKALNSDDLPTLGRPTITTAGTVTFGSSLWVYYNKPQPPLAAQRGPKGRLALGQDGVLGGLGHAEAQDLPFGDLDGLARLRSEAHHHLPGRSLGQYQFADAGNDKRVPGLLVSELGLCLQELAGLFLADTHLFGQGGDDLGFGH